MTTQEPKVGAAQKSIWFCPPSLNDQPVDECRSRISEMLCQRGNVVAQLPFGQTPGSDHKFARRFDERKEMCALVFSDLREVGVRMYPDVFCPARPQQPSQRAAYK